MSDVFDQAQERDAQQLGEALAWQAARALAAPVLVATGNCLHEMCDEPLAPVLVDGAHKMPLFCDPKCAQAHEKTMKQFQTTAVNGRCSF